MVGRRASFAPSAGYVGAYQQISYLASLSHLRHAGYACKHAPMKVYTIETAARAIRGILRMFAVEHRIKILSLATGEADVADNTRERVSAALKQAGGRVGAAAAILGCSRRTLQRLMLKLDMRPEFAGRPSMKTLRERTAIPPSS